MADAGDEVAEDAVESDAASLMMERTRCLLGSAASSAVRLVPRRALVGRVRGQPPTRCFHTRRRPPAAAARGSALLTLPPGERRPPADEEVAEDEGEEGRATAVVAMRSTAAKSDVMLADAVESVDDAADWTDRTEAPSESEAGYVAVGWALTLCRPDTCGAVGVASIIVVGF